MVISPLATMVPGPLMVQPVNERSPSCISVLLEKFVSEMVSPSASPGLEPAAYSRVISIECTQMTCPECESVKVLFPP